MASISASLLAADFACMGEDARRAEQAGADSLHVDVMDGYYVPNIALAPYHLRAIRRFTALPYILHLEVEDPLKMLRAFSGLRPEMVIIQADTIAHPGELFKQIRAEGAKVGLAINPGEPLAAARYLFREIDLLLVMAVGPGFGNQAHHPETPARVAQARAMLREEGLDLPVGSDGGINLANARRLVEAGAGHLVIGTALFEAPDMEGFVREIKTGMRSGVFREKGQGV